MGQEVTDKQKEDILRTLRLIEGAVADIKIECDYIRDVLDENKPEPEEDDYIPL